MKDLYELLFITYILTFIIGLFLEFNLKRCIDYIIDKYFQNKGINKMIEITILETARNNLKERPYIFNEIKILFNNKKEVKIFNRKV